MARPFLGTMTQLLADGMAIVSGDNGTRTGDSVMWEVDLPAGGARVLELWYQLPDSKNKSLPPAQLAIRDAVNLASLEFSGAGGAKITFPGRSAGGAVCLTRERLTHRLD